MSVEATGSKNAALKMQPPMCSASFILTALIYTCISGMTEQTTLSLSHTLAHIQTHAQTHF